jgi:processive 1,2-diacylglycerol beta-glucosyltransferase
MHKKKILIAMLEVGNGHKAPAIALQKTIEELCPNKYDIKVIELAREMGSKWVYKNYRSLWNKSLKYPRLFFMFYHILNNPLSRLIEKIFLTNLTRKSMEYVQKEKPELIIGTHFSCLNVFSRLREKMNIPVIGINIEPFDAHSAWAVKNLDKYVVFSNKAKKLLVKKGVDEKTFVVFENSYPLDPKHIKKSAPKEEIRKKLGLENKKTILVFCGAEGIGNVKKFVIQAVNSQLPFQILMVCGRNEKLKKEMESMQAANLKAFGFVDNMEELIQASDIVLGKAGANQTFEVLIKNKPIVYSSFMRNEYPTLRFVIENKIGWYTPRINDFIILLKSIEKNPKLLESAGKRIKKLRIKSCTPEIAHYLDSYLENANSKKI